jgi:hypothetical protein
VSLGFPARSFWPRLSDPPSLRLRRRESGCNGDAFRVDSPGDPDLYADGLQYTPNSFQCYYY